MDETTYILVAVLVAIYGLVIGSFLNVVIYRVPNGLSLVNPSRSFCPKCKSQIAWYDNIPILSYTILRGKCRHCKEPISFRYTAIEALNCILWLAGWLAFFDGDDLTTIYQAVLVLFIISVSLCIAAIDYERHEILDLFQGMLCVAGALFLLAEPDIDVLKLHILGGVVGLLLFYFGGVIGTAVTKDADAMGGGDVMLAGIVGFIVGIHAYLILFLVMLVWLLNALLYGNAKAKKEKKRKAREAALKAEETKTKPVEPRQRGLIVAFDDELLHPKKEEAEETGRLKIAFAPVLVAGLIIALLLEGFLPYDLSLYYTGFISIV